MNALKTRLFRQSFLIRLGLLAIVALGLAPVAASGQDKTAAAIKILERLDKNGDGKLDPSEIPAQSRAAIDRIAADAGISGKNSISISKLRKRLERDQKEAAKAENDEADDRGRGDRERDRSSETQKSSGSSSGFGSSSKSKSNSSKSGFGAAAGSARDPKTIAYVDSLFKNSDKNRNNYIDKKEIGTVRARNVEKWDANKDGKISRSEVTAYISNGGNARSTSSSGDSKKSGFRTRSTSSQSRKSTSRSKRSSEDRIREYADGLIKKYDKNKNGYLEKDEWGPVRNAEEADKNRNGILTTDELTIQLRQPTKSTSTKSTSTPSRRSSRDERKRDDRRRSSESSRKRDDDKSSPGERKSYRVLTAHERLPSGLPSWFKDKDDNANGQIEMFEYTSSWSDRKLNEFSKLDINDDGVITAKECLKNES